MKRLPPDSETFPASNIGRIFRYVGSADVELPEGDHLGLILELSSVLGSNPAAVGVSPNVFGTNFFGVKMTGGEFFISRPEVEDLKLEEISFEKLFVVVDVNVFSDDDVKDFDASNDADVDVIIDDDDDASNFDELSMKVDDDDDDILLRSVGIWLSRRIFVPSTFSDFSFDLVSTFSTLAGVAGASNGAHFGGM